MCWPGCAFSSNGSGPHSSRAAKPSPPPPSGWRTFSAPAPLRGRGPFCQLIGVRWGRLDPCLPGYVTDTLRQALPLMDRKLHGFAAPDAVLTGVETRSSSPVRILRDERLQSALSGLYPCGEGAGYAGGIVSAAVDGIRVAEAVAQGL